MTPLRRAVRNKQIHGDGKHIRGHQGLGKGASGELGTE